MIDWGIVAKMWAGYGTNIIVLVILLLVAWIVGIVVQKFVKTAEESKESLKGSK